MCDEPLPPPTRRRLHGYDFTDEELADKDVWMKQLARDYPDHNPFMIETVLDFCLKFPEEATRIRKSGEWEKESKFSQANVDKLFSRVIDFCT